MSEAIEKLDGKSMNLEKVNIEKLKELFPNIVTDGKVDFDMLRTLLGDELEESREKYQFTWNGKANAIKTAQIPSTSTLRPCPEKSKNWESTENIYIEGDNLEVLKQLQKTYHGKVKMIYIDPPYNTGHDFVYKDNFNNTIKNYENQTNQDKKSNPETSGRYHTDWLNMMYPRLMLSRNLLTEDGIICISINDIELSNLISLCNEIFGVECFVASLIWKSRQNKDNRNLTGISIDHEYIVCYGRNPEKRFFKGSQRKTDQYSNPDNDPRGPWTSANMAGILSEDKRPNCHYDLVNPITGINYGKPKMGWRYDKNTMAKLIEENRIIWPESADGRPRKKSFLNEVSEVLPGFSSLIGEGIFTRTATAEVEKILNGRFFDFPKPVALLEELIDQVTDTEALVLDFFSGSGTTAEAVMDISVRDGKRKYILVQLPENIQKDSPAFSAGYRNICDIGEERIRRAGEKIKKEWEEKQKSEGLFTDEKEFPVDIGFKVFKLDSSNIETWDNERELNNEGLLQYSNEVFKEGRSKEDVLYEIMLKYGIFDREVSEIDINGKTMYQVGKRYMIVCLEDDLDIKDIVAIGEKKPNTVVFKESGFKDDNAKINAVYNLKKQGVEDVKCI